MDKGFGQKTNPAGKGLWQTHFQKKFLEIPIDVQYYPSPRARCIQDVKNHKADAIYATFSTERAQHLQFPKNEKDELELKKSIDSVAFHFYRNSQTDIRWDGSSFKNAENQKILIQQGIQFEALQKLVRPAEIFEVKTVKQIIDMLKRNRAQAAILAKEQVEGLIKDENSLIISPQPVLIALVFLAFDKNFYAKNTQTVEKIWEAIKLTNSSTSLPE